MGREGDDCCEVDIRGEMLEELLDEDVAVNFVGEPKFIATL
jgi:hypothetical protein